MSLSFSRFQQLRPRAQLLHVLTTGTYLAQRLHHLDIISLYFLPDEGKGFFAEIGLDEVQDCFVVLRSFSKAEPLANYAHQVRLPGG